jgi:hypothetical protein
MRPGDNMSPKQKLIAIILLLGLVVLGFSINRYLKAYYYERRAVHLQLLYDLHHC